MKKNIIKKKNQVPIKELPTRVDQYFSKLSRSSNTRKFMRNPKEL